MENVLKPQNSPEDNLNQENWEALGALRPEITAPKESINLPPADTDNLLKTPETIAELGQITTLENAINVTPVAGQPTYNPDNIKTSGDRLEKSSIAEIDTAVEQLNQTGNLSDFYEEIRGMTEVNLNNSFNRKLYGKGEQK